MRKRLFTFLALAAAALLSLPVMADEVKDANGVITSPADGTHKFYKRSGSYLDNGTQSGRVEIVFCEDGNVYIKDIISQYSQGTWVKGTLSDNTITVVTGQTVYAEEDYWGDMEYYKLYWGANTYDEWWEEYTKSVDKSKEEITFTVSGDVITLEGSSAESFIGIFYVDDWGTNYRKGDYATVWTLDADYQPATTDLVETPAGLETTTWFATGASSNQPFKRSISVGFDGSDVYVQGLFTDFPEAWIKGTITATTPGDSSPGTTATFKAMQYLGQKSNKDCWFTGEDLNDLTMTYDADNKKLTANGSVIAINSESQVSAVATYTGVVLLGQEEKVDELPYSNGFETASDFLQFSVIDANNDGSTWGFTTTNGVYYKYSSSNDGDDWLISPAIKLEAGKLYHFAIDAKSYGNSDPEKMEVKVAAAANAEALSAGSSVLGSTTVASGTFATFDNATVSVSETGYYYFGIHAISEADQYYLYVDNFLVEAGAEATAPDGVTDLSVTQKEGALAAVITFKAPTKKLDGTDLTDNLTKIEILRDEAVIMTFEDVAPGTELSYEDADEALTYGSHNYQVIPYDANGAGKKSDVVNVFLTGTLVAAPADMETATWNAKYTKGKNETKTTVTIGFSGDEVYVKGIFTDFADSWIKGTISEGTTATFATGQYLGLKGSSLIWMTSSDDEDEAFLDFVMTYDADSKVLTAQNELLANYGLDEIYVLARLKNVVIQEGELDEDAATTGDAIDELPYENALNTQDLFNAFGTLNVNNDDGKWSFSQNTSSTYYTYSWASDHADDWLISPAIKLEEGKLYHFAIDARNSNSYDNQTIEVKMAAEAKAGKLTAGQSVIASQTVPSNEYTTFENDAVTVSETGYYHFGIYVGSEAETNLYVTNFLVEEVVAGAPAAITDLAVVQEGDAAEATITFTAPTLTQGGDELTGTLDIDVLRDGEVVRSLFYIEPGQALSLVDATTIGTHVYVVVAKNEAGTGKKSAEATITLTGIIDVPYTADLSNKEVFQLFTVIDGNADNTSWEWASYPGAAKIDNSWNSGNADDYLVTLPIRLETTKSYKVTVKAYTDWTDESFDVVLGKEATAAALTQTVIEKQEISNTSAKDFTGSFTVAEAGNYYLAVHATSEADYSNGLFVTSLAIEAEELPAVTGDPVDELPYENAIATADEFAEFGIIDADVDGTTWKFNEKNTAASYAINWSDGDDWLVTPAIRLEVGKKYHFAIDARNSSKFYESRLEVKMAAEAKASALSAGAEVIAATDVDYTAFATLENEAVTVNATGYYHFGIHAITEDENYATLYVANLLVEEVNTDAPAAVTDLAAEQKDDEAEATITFTAPTLNQGGEALTENLTKIELLRDDEVVNTFEDVAPGTELEYVDATTVGKHVYAVIAYNAAGAGKKSAEATISLTGILTVPYVADFSSKDTYQLFTVIDANSDYTTWEWASYPGAAKFDNSWGNGAGNDYLVSLPIRLEAGKAYKVTVSAETDWSTEKFDVVLGQEATADALTQTVIETQEIDNTSAKDFTGTATVTEDGKYYLAIHATSSTGGYGALIVHSIAIEVDTTTAVETLADGRMKTDGAVYDMQGRKIETGSHLRKGVYIINGKKVSVK